MSEPLAIGISIIGMLCVPAVWIVASAIANYIDQKAKQLAKGKDE